MASVQLPDLLSLGRAFELRTNRHCHLVSSASENSFVTQQNFLSDDEKTCLRSMKIGLWASVCFPTCDSPQLRLATDFLTALVVCNCRLASHAQTARECGWISDDSDPQPTRPHVCLEMIYFARESPPSWRGLHLNGIYSVMPQLSGAMPSDSSRQKFNRSAEGFRAAQMQILSHRRSGTLPTLEAYVELRRDLSGIPMLFDLIEMAESLQMPSGDHRWDSLKTSAADVIALSMDVFASNNDQSIDNSFNIVSILTAHRGVSFQGGLNQTFPIIEQALQTFLSAESALEAPATVQTTNSLWAWIPPLSRKEPSATPPAQVMLSPDSKLYLRGLKDCIVGTLNWGYETELYFGSKGDEVRQFGWVFLKDRNGGREAHSTTTA
ncbi:isoprenoid synthase domain-containing protein [Mycena galopus ATCC 62051]|nr:isoprenoid synthase domain-containing protein [Mycena galopus ATCC 62051]